MSPERDGARRLVVACYTTRVTRLTPRFSLIFAPFPFAALICAACAPTSQGPHGLPTTTGAEVEPPSVVPATSAEPAPEAAAPAETPPGRLVCRMTDAVDGTSELYLDWSGSQAKGVLRQTAKSGMVHVERVKAERAGGLIVVDEPAETDLVTHAALLQQLNGALQMRLGKGMSGSWARCEQESK